MSVVEQFRRRVQKEDEEECGGERQRERN